MTIDTQETDATTDTSRAAGRPSATPSSVSLLDLLVILVPRKSFILLTAIICGGLAFLIAFLMKPTYTAEAVIMTPERQQSSLTALLSISSLAGLGAGGSGAGSLLKDPNSVYIGILKSETIANDLIGKFHLAQVYKTKYPTDTRKSLASHSDITSGKDSLIHIEFSDHDRQRAADVANAYVAELFAQNSRLALTEASYRRQYLEVQLENEKNQLADAEVDLKQTQEKTGLFQATTQAQASIVAIESLRANITANEVQLQSLQQSATEENPQVVRLRSELQELRSQLANLERKSSSEPGNVFVPTAKVPAVALEYTRKLREVKYHETLFELLARQYEAAKLDEARAAPVIQVVDKAEVPDVKSSPHRLLMAAVAGFLGFFGAIFYILFRHYLTILRQDYENGPKLALLQSQLRWKR
jgi:tyrosine-protein kinase Etk/Wzc